MYLDQDAQITIAKLISIGLFEYQVQNLRTVEPNKL